MIRAQFMSKVQQRGLKKGAIFFTLPNYLGKPSLEPFIKLDVSIQEQVLTLEFFDEHNKIRYKTFECPINDTTIFRLSNIHDKVKKASHFYVDLKYLLLVQLSDENGTKTQIQSSSIFLLLDR